MNRAVSCRHPGQQVKTTLQMSRSRYSWPPTRTRQCLGDGRLRAAVRGCPDDPLVDVHLYPRGLADAGTGSEEKALTYRHPGLTKQRPAGRNSRNTDGALRNPAR